MIAAWMLYALAIGAISCVAAITAEWAMKSLQRPVRFVWITAIAVTTLLTISAPLRFERSVATRNENVLVLPTTVTVVEHTPSMFEQLAAGAQLALSNLVAPIEKLVTLAGAAPAYVNRSAAIIWLATSTLSLVLLLVVYTRSRRESTRWPRLRLWGNNVRVAPDVGPAVIGMAPPEIVIPEWVLKRNEDEQKLVLQHEAEHVRAHDPLLLMIACVAVALMPWHAALWFMWSRLRLAVELDCDRRVLDRGVLKPAYGELLVELSSQRPWNSLVTPAFSWGTSHLEKRIVAMTTRPAKLSLARKALSVGVVAMSLVAACRSELPTATEIASMDATSAAARIGKIADSVVMIVDGKRVSETDAKAIPSDDIASVQVMKTVLDRPLAEVHITLLPDSVRNENEKKRSQFKTVLDSSARVSTAAIIADTAQFHPMLPNDPRGDALIIAANSSAAGLHSASDSTSAGVVRATQGCVNGHIEGGTGARIRIRGQSSISAACQPLLIVDGVIIAQSSYEGLTPERIESIEVVKGAAAISTYGPRAVNGVILIKTRK